MNQLSTSGCSSLNTENRFGSGDGPAKRAVIEACSAPGYLLEIADMAILDEHEQIMPFIDIGQLCRLALCCGEGKVITHTRAGRVRSEHEELVPFESGQISRIDCVACGCLELTIDGSRHGPAA